MYMLIPNQYFNSFNQFVKNINSDLKSNPIVAKKTPIKTVVVGPIEELK
ncbi:hypothetical protein NJT12_11205 [Flavobacterium sp. AC]|uniref:Uncharacterized protein n=1 Tax=Flavobacterium azizsancarii TaxID=2961580 RepID=A0ABT4WC77_9FLAO|nr:hypothetical protein [Flavobacterium azizsancarii]MDA6070185.1 hypothetical protein [Flavobacterium azizsancarii]